MSSVFALSLIMLAAGPVHSLDNGVIRVDVDPRIFAVTYVGIKDGINFVTPLPLDETTLDSAEWADAGGLHTDIIPYAGKDAPTRRGPAEIVEVRSDYIAMLSPPSEATGVRLKKEIQLIENKPRARFRVTMQHVGKDPVRYSLRNTVRLGPGTTVRTERTDGDIKVLAGADSIFPAVVKSRRYWLIPIPPTSDTHNLILGALVRSIVLANDSGTWTRTLTVTPGDPAAFPNQCSFLCLLDDKTQSYGAALQGPTAELKTGDIVTLEEDWSFEKRGR